MSVNIIVKKGLAQKLRKMKMTSQQAKRITKAIVGLYEFDLKTLIMLGKVKRVDVSNYNNLYMFKVGPKERMLFSPIDDQILIHDIIEVNNKDSKNAILAAQE